MLFESGLGLLVNIFANSKATTGKKKKEKKRSITDMLRKKGKLINSYVIVCSIKTMKITKRMEDKNRNKEQG